MHLKIIIPALLIIVLWGCKSKVHNAQDSSTEVKKEIPTDQNLIEGVSTMPFEKLKDLFDRATYVDYIFNDLPFAVSQDDKKNVQANIAMIDPNNKPDKISNSCKPLGREFFHIDGEIVYEADIYYSDGCYGYVFMKNNKPIYAHKIMETGMNFYGNLVKHSKQLRDKANGKLN